MSKAGWPLQKVIFTALSGNAALQDLIGDPPRIFDDPPGEVELPYVQIGDGTETDWSTKTEGGAEHLVKLGDGGAPETFTAMAGLRTTSLGFNAQSVDITNADSANMWRELLANAGVRQASVSGSGVFKDAASDATVRSIFFNQDLKNWKIVVPDFGEIMGAFAVTALQYEGAYDGEVKMSLTLASAGALTFTAV